MKKTRKDIKTIVQEKYDQIAKGGSISNSCCGGSGCCTPTDYTVFSDDYSRVEGYFADADLNLGCGLPTVHAGIMEGQTVLDLGSGAGNDCFVARSIVGEKGKVIGIDFSKDMLKKARENAAKLGYKNVVFVESEIENIDLPDEHIDVVISNCVLNLVPDKAKAFGEVFRVLKKGGHFCISDVVTSGELPEALKEDAELYAGCVAGAISKEHYLQHIMDQGFNKPEIKKEKMITLPDTLLKKYLDPASLFTFKTSETGVFSITVTAKKP